MIPSLVFGRGAVRGYFGAVLEFIVDFAIVDIVDMFMAKRIRSELKRITIHLILAFP
jgi:hypothetical protein